MWSIYEYNRDLSWFMNSDIFCFNLHSHTKYDWEWILTVHCFEAYIRYASYRTHLTIHLKISKFIHTCVSCMKRMFFVFRCCLFSYIFCWFTSLFSCCFLFLSPNLNIVPNQIANIFVSVLRTQRYSIITAHIIANLRPSLPIIIVTFRW